MKIKNLARFLLVVFLLATGTNPVIAHESSHCGSMEPIRPGDSVTDAVSDVPAAHIDITEVNSSLSGETLTVVFHLRDLPEALMFNRAGYGKGNKEYEWKVAIDADNDRSTGPGGFDYLLTAYHIALLSQKRVDTTAPIREMVEASVWETRSDGSTSTFADAVLAVSVEADTITVVGVIPGITSESRLAYEAYDVQFAGEADQIECHTSYSKSVGPWGCDAGAAVIGPGQSVTDEIEDGTAEYVDVTEVSTSLSGETLTVVFHLRNVPETLTFNRTGILENHIEYAWVVAIDVDSDRASGDSGFEYQLSAYHTVPQYEKGSNAEVPIESKAEASVWKVRPGSITAERNASLEVSAEEDTITISGYVPGISAEARLAFRTHEYFGSSDEVGCHVPQSQSTPSGQCDADDAVTPGQSIADEVADVPAAHIDITEVETSLSGETLTVVFHLRDLPESLTFNRTEFPTGTKEYEWEVSIDADNDRSTGPGGFDYLLSAYHIVRQSERTNIPTAPIEDVVEARIWETHADGGSSEFAHASFEVSAEADTITLVGVIPGITSESRLAFATDDAQFLDEPDEIACHDPYRKFVGPWQCDAGIAVINPGQSVLDGLEDNTHRHRDRSGDAWAAIASAFAGDLSAYMDITKVNTSLSGERLTVIFHLRDVPETLTFNRTGISENYMEYRWEVAIDVDNDRATGDGGFDTLLSAYHIVRLSEGSENMQVPIESKAKASVWKMRPGRIMSERDASLEVSAEEDTIMISGYIPGITAESRLAFKTNEYSAGSDEVGCQEPPVLLTSSSQCDLDEAATPGESVIDDVSDALAAHMDITEISTSISGETLTVVFHFRDVPETLTFDRTGVPDNMAEYSWEVLIDVDGDRETGFEGFDYILSSIYVTSYGSGGRDRNAAIATDDVQTNTWALKSAGEAFPAIEFLGWARIEVSAEEDTITLSGRIPGITAESQLAFGVYDYLGGAEEVGCLSSFSLGRPVFRGPSDGSAAVSDQAVFDNVSHELAGHIDIRGVTTALDGETLTATFQLKDVPETFTFDRTGVPAHALEYSWEVSIDVDNDPETGTDGFDYMLSAGYFVHPLSRDSNTVAQLTQPGFVEVSIWGLDREGNRVLAEGSIEVSTEENTITLSGEIPGITGESPLQFKAYDYFDGSVEMSN